MCVYHYFFLCVSLLAEDNVLLYCTYLNGQIWFGAGRGRDHSVEGKKVRPALQHRPTTVNNTESSLSFSILLVTRLNCYFMRGFITYPAHVFCCFPGNRHFCAFSFSVGLCIRIVSLIVHTKNYFLKHRVITFSYF